MAGDWVLVGAGLGLACAAFFLVAAKRTWRRARDDASLPLSQFAVFWLGAAGYVGADALWSLAWIAGQDSLPLGVAILQLKLAAVCASFAGLVAYLLAIYTGRKPRTNLAVASAYLALFLALESYYMWRGPLGDHVGFASLGLDYARGAPAVWRVLVVLLFGPPLVAAAAYARLWRVATEPGARRRVALTSASLFVFFAPELAGWFVGTWPGWFLVERGLALAAGVGMLVATSVSTSAQPDAARSLRRAS